METNISTVQVVLMGRACGSIPKSSTATIPSPKS